MKGYRQLSTATEAKLIELTERLKTASERAEQAGRDFAAREGEGKSQNHSYSYGYLIAEVNLIAGELEQYLKYIW